MVAVCLIIRKAFSILKFEQNYRNRLVKLLQAELECLRGPLNEDDLPTEPPCLIHIWIPSAFLTGQPSDIHHVYQVIRFKCRNLKYKFCQVYSYN